MTNFGFGRLGIALGAVMAVASCQMGNGDTPFGKSKSVAADAGRSELITVVGGGDTDVEAPKVFSLTDKALWDGRPSLGGVWVAHTSVKDPERVIIRNPATGKSVIGALFRREIDNPGPSLQLSSDAAEALGLLAGQPATISVVALRRAEPAPAPEAAPVASTETAAVAKDVKTKDTKAKPATAATIDQKTLETSAAAAIDKAAAQASKAKTKPKAGAKAATAAAPKAAAVEAPKPASGAAVPAQRPYIQIGIFTVEANAKKAVAQLTKAGISAAVKPDQSQGKTFWRVIVGPVATVAERDALAAKVKALGYPDSYPVTK